MKITATDLPTDAKRFGLSPFRIILLAGVVCAIYGGGILMAVKAGYATVEAAHAGGEIPYLPWSLAFFFVIGGMLSVVYAFFFRPREVRLTGSEVAVIWWDGNGKGMRRDQIESVAVTASGIRLTGGGETLKIGTIFSDWKRLGKELQAWTVRPAKQSA